MTIRAGATSRRLPRWGMRLSERRALLLAGNTLCAGPQVKLQHDLYYIKHQSLWLDLTIMLRTIEVVLGIKGA